MRVAEIAELVGTSVRTVRYYHQVGLLPVPPTRGGYRDYDLRHVARLSRIRWLSMSGVALASIAEMLAHDVRPEREAVRDDLRATLDAVELQIDELAVRRDRLLALIDRVESGRSLSPAPDVVLAFYDEMETRAGDDRTRRAVRRERDFIELAYFRGQAPPETELLYLGLDPPARDASLAAFGRVAEEELSAEEVERLAASNAARMIAQFGAGGRQAADVDPDALRNLYGLFAATGSRREKVLGEAVLRHLLAAIEERSLS